MLNLPALEPPTIFFIRNFQHVSSNLSRCLMNRVEGALSWELRPGGPVCAADSLCGVRQAMTPS